MSRPQRRPARRCRAPRRIEPAGLESEIALGIAIADVLDHSAHQRAVGGNEPGLDVRAQQRAEHPAEIFVPHVAEEAARIGQHADETAEQPEPR